MSGRGNALNRHIPQLDGIPITCNPIQTGDPLGVRADDLAAEPFFQRLNPFDMVGMVVCNENMRQL